MVGTAEWQEQRQIPQLESVELLAQPVTELTKRKLAKVSFTEEDFSNVVLGYN